MLYIKVKGDAIPRERGMRAVSFSLFLILKVCCFSSPICSCE